VAATHPNSAGLRKSRGGTARTEGGDDMVGLDGGRKQRWRREPLLLPADMRET
jgi:hypothetical protein